MIVVTHICTEDAVFWAQLTKWILRYYGSSLELFVSINHISAPVSESKNLFSHLFYACFRCDL